MFASNLALFILIGYLTTEQCVAYTALLTMHGTAETMNDSSTFRFNTRLQQILRDQHLEQDYDIVNVGLSDDTDRDYCWSTFASMTFQLYQLCDYISDESVWQRLSSAQSVILVGFSQGGLLLRGLLWTQCLDPLLPKIDRLITFGSPNSGVYGKPDCGQLDTSVSVLVNLCYALQDLEGTTHLGPGVYNALMYTKLAEKNFAPASYWNAPASGGQADTWLARINNNNSNRTGERYLATKLRRGLIMVTFERENIVLPGVSADFGYWSVNGSVAVRFNETELYRADWIGLRELSINGLVRSVEIRGQSHLGIPDQFIANEFMQFIADPNKSVQSDSSAGADQPKSDVDCCLAVFTNDSVYGDCVQYYREQYEREPIENWECYLALDSVECYNRRMRRICSADCARLEPSRYVDIQAELVRGCPEFGKRSVVCYFYASERNRQILFYGIIGGVALIIAVVAVISYFKCCRRSSYNKYA